MKLNVEHWKPFKVGGLFTLYNGKGITKEEIDCNPGSFPAVHLPKRSISEYETSRLPI